MFKLPFLILIMEHNLDTFMTNAYQAGLDMSDEELKLKYYLMILFEQQYKPERDGDASEYMCMRLNNYDLVGVE